MPDLTPFRVPEFRMPDMSGHFEALRTAKERDLGFAHVMFEQLMAQVKDYESTLKPDEEVAAYLSSFGSQILLQIEKIGFMNPYLIILYGWNIDTGSKVRLLQHTTQLSILFTSIKVKIEERPARRIGFFQE